MIYLAEVWSLSPTGQRDPAGCSRSASRPATTSSSSSTRRRSNFWAASYGQIYPELKRLEDQGLVRGRQEPTGERARTVYDLTAAGQAALEEWLASDAELIDESRDEGMLKLFFSDVLPEQRIENIRAMRALHERKLAHAARDRASTRASGARART